MSTHHRWSLKVSWKKDCLQSLPGTLKWAFSNRLPKRAENRLPEAAAGTEVLVAAVGGLFSTLFSSPQGRGIFSQRALHSGLPKRVENAHSHSWQILSSGRSIHDCPLYRMKYMLCQHSCVRIEKLQRLHTWGDKRHKCSRCQTGEQWCATIHYTS